jgi:hypothetical protein
MEVLQRVVISILVGMVRRVLALIARISPWGVVIGHASQHAPILDLKVQVGN